MKQKVLFEIKCIEWITDYWESLLVPRVCLDQWELILFLDVKILQQPPLQGKCAEILRPLDLIYDKIKKRKCACFIINRDTNESRVLCLSWVNQHKNDLLFHSIKARVFLRNYGICLFIFTYELSVPFPMRNLQLFTPELKLSTPGLRLRVEGTPGRSLSVNSPKEDLLPKKTTA